MVVRCTVFDSDDMALFFVLVLVSCVYVDCISDTPRTKAVDFCKKEIIQVREREKR